MPVAVILIGSLGDGLAPPPSKGQAPRQLLPMVGIGLLPLIIMFILGG